jgi:hypothetical protein
VIQNQRVIDHTTDVSTTVNDFRAANYGLSYQTGRHLYIGVVLPLNNIWFEIATPSEVTGVTVTPEIWWGNAWHPAVDVIDQTDGLRQSGRIQWNTNRSKSWDFEQTTKDVSGLAGFDIYWKYWLRLSWSSNLTASIRYIGQKYSNDATLYSFYPDLNNNDMKLSFAPGKTTWDEQHFMAAEHIEMDLRRKDIIKNRGQIMDWHLLQNAACHKVASIVYTAFGEPYLDQLTRARADYADALNVKYFDVDLSGNGSLEPVERAFSTAFMTR